MSAAKRQRLVDTFQEADADGPEVFLATTSSCGTGITLTAASDVIFLEPTWNPFGKELQAMQRIHRIG